MFELVGTFHFTENCQLFKCNEGTARWETVNSPKLAHLLVCVGIGLSILIL